MIHAKKKRKVCGASDCFWGQRRWNSPGLVAVLLGAALLDTGLLSTATLAAPPLVPLVAPLYSFDANSPRVLDGTVSSSDLLAPAGDTPVAVVRAADIGLGRPGDAVDGLSGLNSGVAATDSFAILFSVDRQSVGLALPDILLTAQGVPYNITDQAAKGQAAGDQFMSLSLYTRSGGLLLARNALASANDTLVRNNYDEGGVDFSAGPAGSAADVFLARGQVVPQDNVNSTSGTAIPPSARSTGPVDVGPFFFTLTADSPSLQFLPSSIPSGANLYFVPDPTVIPPQTDIFASFADLGLVQADDINAVIVFDVDGDGLFNASDQVMFTLARGSPSLDAIGAAGIAVSPADVFAVDPSRSIIPIATAASLGLDGATDSIDALDYLPCADADACAASHGIREPPPSIPAVSTWGLMLMALTVLIAATVVLRRRRAIVAQAGLHSP